MRILAAAMATFSGVDLALWLLGGALIGVLVGRWMSGGLRALSTLLGDLIAGTLGALAAIALVGYFVNLAGYSVGGRLVVALVGGAIFVALARGAQYRRTRRPVATPRSEIATPDETSTTPRAIDDTYRADDGSRTPTAAT